MLSTMTTSTEQLDGQLTQLRKALPRLVKEYPDAADFWPAFAGMADVIEDNAGVLASYASERIQKMLGEFGLAENS